MQTDEPLLTLGDEEFRNMLYRWLGGGDAAALVAGRTAFGTPRVKERTVAELQRLQVELTQRAVDPDVAPVAHRMIHRALDRIPGELAALGGAPRPPRPAAPRPGPRPARRAAGSEAEQLAGLDDAAFGQQVRAWLAADYEVYLRQAPVFRDARVAERTLMAIAGAQQDPEGGTLLPSRAGREIAKLVEVVRWGRPLPKSVRPGSIPGPASPADLTMEDAEEIDYLTGADDAEYAQALGEWLTLGDDDGSGERVFLSPRLVKRTYRAVGALIHQTTVAISKAHRDSEQRSQLQEHVTELTRVRLDLADKAGLRRSREPVTVPTPTGAELLEIQYLADEADDDEYTGIVSDWLSAEVPDPSGERVLLSPQLVERTLPVLTVLYERASRYLATAQSKPDRRNPDRIRDLKARRRRIYLTRARAFQIAKQVRKDRSRRRGPATSPRQHAHKILAARFSKELADLRKKGLKSKQARHALATEHYQLFAEMRRRIEDGADPQEILLDLCA